MANFKSGFVFALLSLGMVAVNPAVGQTTISPLDLWLTFAELLTGDVLTELSKVQLPNLIPNLDFSDFLIPDISDIIAGKTSNPVPVVPAPVVPVPVIPAPVPAPCPPQSSQPQIIYYIPNAPAPAPAPAPATSPPPTARPTVVPVTVSAPIPTAAPIAVPVSKCNQCQPEKVRIVVVSDCDHKKDHESSESSESSEEAQILVPYQKRGRYHFQKSNY